MEIKLNRTSEACPEQYDAFFEGSRVGYLRLRHKYFRVDFPGCGDETIYEGAPEGDGIFEDRDRPCSELRHYVSNAPRLFDASIIEVEMETPQTRNTQAFCSPWQDSFHLWVAWPSGLSLGGRSECCS